MGAGASAAVASSNAAQNISAEELVQRFASTLDSPDSARASSSLSSPQGKLSKKGTTVSVKVLLRHPTHNVPDLFYGEFFVNSKKGAVIKGSKYKPIENFSLRDIDDIYAAQRDVIDAQSSAGDSFSPSVTAGFPNVPLNPPPRAQTYFPPPTFTLLETRAQAFSICESANDVWLVPASRFDLYYSGITLLIGDTYNRTKVHRIKCGDILKLGSTSLFVTELDRGGGDVESMDKGKLAWIFQAFGKSAESGELPDMTGVLPGGEREGEESTLPHGLWPKKAGDENDNEDDESKGEGEAEADQAVEDRKCYICTDAADEDDDPLVNPCNCKGGTKWVHVSCLRQWVIKDKDEHICMVQSTTGENTYKCSVCKSPYKYEVRQRRRSSASLSGKEPGAPEAEDDGAVRRTKTQIFDRSVRAPSLTCVVVISSDASALPRGKVYSISFSSLVERESLRPVTIGRNAECDVVLQCNSVSNYHAKVHWYNNDFYLTDDHSSNGTHVYLRKPMKVERGKETVLRIGRSTIKVATIDYWKARIDPSAHFLKQPAEATNPNYHMCVESAKKGDEGDEGDEDYRNTLRNISFFNIENNSHHFDNAPLKMLMRSMIPIGSAAYLMNAMRYRKLHGLEDEDYKTVISELGIGRDTSYDGDGELGTSSADEVTSIEGNRSISELDADVDARERRTMLDGRNEFTEGVESMGEE
mmetsp:Transcript_16181/g.32263  ORF Transcript_16181/g.32263 Transcript_16181/m.32263 type:complete len:700 (-) Transcript_16181:70-2169(-)